MEAAQPTLLFIPDITGFTRFVAETETQHAGHIIRELLEILMESNQIALEVSEIEGDAILFYRFGKAPTAAELLVQVQKMFVNFHQHLKRYEHLRICQCGACRSAHELTLKFVVHYGEVALNPVKQHTKLFGKDVIVAHRLMKNTISNHEYALFTDTLVRACPTWVDVSVAAWADVETGEETYDAGPVTFCFLPLAALMEQVEDVPLPDPIFKGKAIKVLERQLTFTQPAEEIFQIVIDLPRRVDWFEDAVGIDWRSKHRINRVGTRHRCLYESRDNKVIVVTEGFKKDETSFCFSETDPKGKFSCNYVFEQIDEQTSRFREEVWLKDTVLLRLVYRFLIKKKITHQVESSFALLEDLLDQPQASEHPQLAVG